MTALNDMAVADTDVEAGSVAGAVVKDSVRADHWSDLGEWARARRSPAELAEEWRSVQDAPRRSHSKGKTIRKLKEDRLRQIEGLIERVRKDAAQLENRQRELRGQIGAVVYAIEAELAGGDGRRGAMVDFVKQLAAQADDKQHERHSLILELVDDIEVELARDDLAADAEAMGLAVRALYLCLMALVWQLDAKGTATRMAALAPGDLDTLDALGLLAVSRDPVPVALFVRGRMAQALDQARARKAAAPSRSDEARKLARQQVRDNPATNAAEVMAMIPGRKPSMRDLQRIVAEEKEAARYRT